MPDTRVCTLSSSADMSLLSDTSPLSLFCGMEGGARQTRLGTQSQTRPIVAQRRYVAFEGHQPAELVLRERGRGA